MIKYNIISTKDGSNIKENLTFDEVFEYKLENLEKDDFDILPIEGKAKKEKKSEQSEEEFLKTLTPAQYNDIHLGYKEVVFKGNKWGLKKLKDAPESSHYSHQEAKRNREANVLAQLKTAIKANEDNILMTLHLIMPNVIEQEFETAFKTILK